MMALGATERIHEWQVEKTSLGFEYAEAFPERPWEISSLMPWPNVSRVGLMTQIHRSW